MSFDILYCHQQHYLMQVHRRIPGTRVTVNKNISSKLNRQSTSVRVACESGALSDNKATEATKKLLYSCCLLYCGRPLYCVCTVKYNASTHLPVRLSFDLCLSSCLHVRFFCDRCLGFYQNGAATATVQREEKRSGGEQRTEQRTE